jgi:acetylornithine deacetylase
MERDELRQLASDMVAIPSVNPLDGPIGEERGEQAMALFVQSRLQAAGIVAELTEAAPGRPSVLARLPGEREEALLFDAHLDTVSGAGMESPFQPRVENDTLSGRGAADDKGSLAAMMAALIDVARAGGRPPYTILLTATADEEYRMSGMNGLLESQRIAPRAAVVGEPTSLEVVVAHRGVARFAISTVGKAAHGSRPEEGVNAIYRMARVVQALEHYARGGVGRDMHPLLGKATLSVNVIRAGEYANVIPDYCEVIVDRRLLPNEDGRKVIVDVRTYLASAIEDDVGLHVSSPSLFVPGLSMSADDPWVKVVATAVKAVTGKLTISGLSGATHAGPLAQTGVPAVVLGPGSIGQAHTTTEALDLTQLEQAAEIYASLMRTGAVG